MELNGAEARSEMSRSDRRIIHAKLEEVYESEETGYKAPWTDQSVARDLGSHIPVGWIVKIREESFGPTRSNPEITDMLLRVDRGAVEAKAILDECKEYRKDMVALVERGNTLMKKATEVGKVLEGILAISSRIERSVLP